MKMVCSDKKSGKSAQFDVDKDRSPSLIGKKMGDSLDGSIIGLDGFELHITGLSDKTGAPSRKEIEGSIKARPLLSAGTGIRHAKKGHRARKLIRGNTISADTEQVNAVITKYGQKPLEEIFKAREKAEKK
jgi:small subunit ribosomal protein S6e